GRGGGRFGMVDPEDLACRAFRGEFGDCAAAAAADVEDRVMRPDRDVVEAPVRDGGMAPVHTQELEAAEPSGGLAGLRYGHIPRSHVRSNRRFYVVKGASAARIGDGRSGARERV